MYTYEPRPTCSIRSPSCNSQYLFCSIRNGISRCISKVKMNGNCRGFEQDDACYNGMCINGICRPPPSTLVTFQHFICPLQLRKQYLPFM